MLRGVAPVAAVRVRWLRRMSVSAGLTQLIRRSALVCPALPVPVVATRPRLVRAVATKVIAQQVRPAKTVLAVGLGSGPVGLGRDAPVRLGRTRPGQRSPAPRRSKTISRFRSKLRLR